MGDGLKYTGTAGIAGRSLNWAEGRFDRAKVWLATGLRLWPWLVADAIFVLFLAVSTQGHAQADSLFERAGQRGWLLGGLAVSFLLTLTACLSTSLLLACRSRSVELGASSGDAAGPSAVATPENDSALRYIIWSFGLAAIPGLALACAASEVVIAVVVLTAFAASAWVVYYLLHGRCKQVRLGFDNLVKLHRIRFLLASTVTALAAGPLWLGASLSVRDPDALQRIGAAALELIGLSAVSTLFGAVFVALPQCGRWPRLTQLSVVALVVWNLSSQPLADPQNPLLRDERMRAAKDVHLKEQAGLCRHATPELNLDRHPVAVGEVVPVVQDFVVGAEGGGIRAAFWTAVGLGFIDLSVAEDFGQKLRLISGVSGGSLGIATWLAARETPGLSASARLDLVSNFLSSDFLASSVAGLLFLDAPRLVFGGVWPTTRRDDLFEAAIVKRWLALKGSDFFLRRLDGLCFTEFKRPPQVFFNATEALAGVPTSVGNTQTALPTGNHHLLTALLKDSSLKFATVSQVAVMSARFPFLSPAADIGIKDDMLQWHIKGVAGDRSIVRNRAEGGGPGNATQDQPLFSREKHAAMKPIASPCDDTGDCGRLGVLVDGGYFDNSGLQLVRSKLLGVLDPHTKAPEAETKLPANAGPLRVGVIQFINSPGGLCTLNPDLKTKLPSSLMRLLAGAKFEPICDYESKELRATRTQRSFQWLTSPAEALLAVREGHALHEKQQMFDLVNSRMPNSAYRDLSLSNAMSGKNCVERANLLRARVVQKYGLVIQAPAPGVPVSRDSELENSLKKQMERLPEPAQKEVKDVFKLAQVESLACQRLRKKGDFAGLALVTGSPNDLRGVRAQISQQLSEEINHCRDSTASPYPPLGWSLRPSDTKTLRCLAASGAYNILVPSFEASRAMDKAMMSQSRLAPESSAPGAEGR